MYTGEDLIDSLTRAFESVEEPMGIIASCVGMIKNATHGYFEGNGNYRYAGFDEPREIVSLTGNIMKSDNGVHTHLHVSVAGSDGIVTGGHLKDAKVHGTAELMLILSGISAKRVKEEETGLEGLKL